jgi:hypothetical protein
MGPSPSIARGEANAMKLSELIRSLMLENQFLILLAGVSLGIFSPFREATSSS